MKFVCRKCDTNMTYQDTESTGIDSLGVLFACESCGASFSMVTNPGETHLVSALGAKLARQTPDDLEAVLGAPRDAEKPTSDGATIAWSPEAKKRLENIPAFVRPFAMKEIERIARDDGHELVTEEVLDAARGMFMGA